MILTLQRVYSGEEGTFGVLSRLNRPPFAVTLEDPWLDNRVNVSCIPSGSWLCDRVNSPRFGNTFEVTEVPGRSLIRFHPGNDIDDTQGCILVGERFEDRGIVDSRRGFEEFLRVTAHVDQFHMVIK